MSIDWAKPCETTEDPPRPVRVLCTDGPGTYPIITLLEGEVRRFMLDGREFMACGGVTLRNVSPPKPEPVLWTAWLNLTKDGVVVAHADEDEADEEMTANAAGFHTFVERRTIQWMSDGSTVPRDDTARADKWFEEARSVTRDRDHWKAKAEALQAEVDRLLEERSSSCQCEHKPELNKVFNECLYHSTLRERAEKAERECGRLGFVVDAQVRRASQAAADLAAARAALRHADKCDWMWKAHHAPAIAAAWAEGGE